MSEVPAFDSAIGMGEYVTETPGIGGQLKTNPDDFVVTELEAFDYEPLTADRGSYPHLVVRVELVDRETNAFATALANRLGISRKRVNWAGTKDKRAITTQLMTLTEVQPEPVRSVSLAGADIEVLGRAGRPIRLGDLVGNEFEVTVRDVTAPDQVEETTAGLRQFGDGTVAVPNYFGQQRFGSKRPITHRVGAAILDGDWAEAHRRYVCESADTEPAETQQARADAGAALADGDYQAALTALPDRLTYERTLLHASVAGATPREAFEDLPENLQRLFVHAAQSALFNRIITHRLEAELPFAHPVVGDIVCFADSERSYEFPVPDPDRTQSVTERRLETVTRHCNRHRAFVTGPLFGTETTPATGKPGAIEQAVLEEATRKPADFALPGDWETTGHRRALLVPTTPTVTIEDNAVTFEFTLPKGAYATVLLREYMKAPPTAYE